MCRSCLTLSLPPGSRFIGALTKVEYSNMFVLKTAVNMHPYGVVTTTLASAVVVLAYVVHICER